MRFWYLTHMFKDSYPLYIYNQPSSGASALNYGQSPGLHPCLMCGSSEGSGEIAQIHSLV